VVFIDHFKRLPDSMKRRFLLKHEMGLRANAIARILGDEKMRVANSISEAESMLSVSLGEEGCPNELTPEVLYRGSRMVKPPASWDREILDSFDIWLRQTSSPLQSEHQTRDEEEEVPEDGGTAEKIKALSDSFISQARQLWRKLGSKDIKRLLSVTHR